MGWKTPTQEAREALEEMSQEECARYSDVVQCIDRMNNLLSIVETCRIALSNKNTTETECQSIANTLYYFVEGELDSIKEEMQNL